MQIEKHRAGFIYTIEHRDFAGRLKSVERIKNLMPGPAVNYLLNAAFTGASQFTNWYLGVYDANRTPLSTDTMTTFLADCSEDSSYTIVSGQRQQITFGAVVDGAIVSTVSPNVLAFTAAATIRGAFITTNSAWGNNAGLLMSAVLFPTAKNMSVGDTLTVPVGFALISA